MPYGDRTGPWGRGSRTGRGAGFCAGYDIPGYMNDYVPRMGMGRGRESGRGFGRGLGRGQGPGFGHRLWFRREVDSPYPPHESEPYYRHVQYAKPDPEAEKEYLKDLVKSLEEELTAVKDRLKEITSSKNEK